MPEETSEVQALRLRFEDVRRENERLRDARSDITKQLGPLPISAAVVAGLITGFETTGKSHLDHTLTRWALGVFAAMVCVSVLSSVLKPYRRLRDKVEAKADGPKPGAAKSPKAWYEAMIELEENVRGTTKSGFWPWVARHSPVPIPFFAKDLQSACDQEWKGLFLTKMLFVAVIVLLILARLDGEAAESFRPTSTRSALRQSGEPPGRACLAEIGRCAKPRSTMSALPHRPGALDGG